MAGLVGVSVLRAFVCSKDLQILGDAQKNVVQELMEEQSRRMAAESKIAGITAERDAYHQECKGLELKLKSMQRELENAHCQMVQGQGGRGSMRQPQPLPPGTHDMPHGSDAAEVNIGQTCTVNHLGIAAVCVLASLIACSRLLAEAWE